MAPNESVPSLYFWIIDKLLHAIKQSLLDDHLVHSEYVTSDIGLGEKSYSIFHLSYGVNESSALTRGGWCEMMGVFYLGLCRQVFPNCTRHNEVLSDWRFSAITCAHSSKERSFGTPPELHGITSKLEK